LGLFRSVSSRLANQEVGFLAVNIGRALPCRNDTEFSRFLSREVSRFPVGSPTDESGDTALLCSKLFFPAFQTKGFAHLYRSAQNSNVNRIRGSHPSFCSNFGPTPCTVQTSKKPLHFGFSRQEHLRLLARNRCLAFDEDCLIRRTKLESELSAQFEPFRHRLYDSNSTVSRVDLLPCSE
jgi:hypothetical protein